MAKNSQAVTKWLNLVAQLPKIDVVGADAYFAACEPVNEMWLSLRADGWSVAEFDEAYFRRFGRKPRRPEAENE